MNPRNTSYSIDVLAVAKDFHAFVTAVGLDRPVLCGFWRFLYDIGPIGFIYAGNTD